MKKISVFSMVAIIIFLHTTCNNDSQKRTFQVVELQSLLSEKYPKQKNEIQDVLTALFRPTHLQKKPENIKNELYDYFLKNKNKDIYRWHHYFRAYDKHFRKFKDKPVKVLEIGVGEGGSLKMWKYFFGKDSKVVGLDINPECEKYSSKDITIIIGDQTDIELLKSVNQKHGPFDVVIDDGGHTATQQIITFITMFPLLSENGVYLCEDTHTSYFKGYMDMSDQYTFMTFAKYLVDRLNESFFESNGNIHNLNSTVSYFSAHCRSIHFYDSMVFFTKSKRLLPFVERR